MINNKENIIIKGNKRRKERPLTGSRTEPEILYVLIEII